MESVARRLRLELYILLPYVQPVCFFTAGSPLYLSAICEFCAYITTAKLFGRVCAASERYAIHPRTKEIVEASFPVSSAEIRFRLNSHYLGDAGVPTDAKVQLFTGLCEDAGIHALKADLQHPNFEFCVLFDYISAPTRFIFAVAHPVGATKRSELKHYQLSARPYIGPTSMDSELASIMASLAEIKPGDWVYDCFCGTTSVLTAVSAEGACCFGSDYDYNVLRGRKMRSPVLNFRQYSQTTPDLLSCDCFRIPLRPALIDAIVCDPPYSVRASCSAAQIEALYLQLIADAVFLLRQGGKLVFWMPVAPNFDRTREIFFFDGGKPLVQQYCMFQKLSSRYGRILLVFEKSSADYTCRCQFNGNSGLGELRAYLGLPVRGKTDSL